MRISDWSSDVCSSDLLPAAGAPAQTPVPEMAPRMAPQPAPSVPDQALHQAARTNDVDLAAYALERGAGLELRDQLGTTPLQVPARYGSPTVAERLRQRGAAREEDAARKRG